MTYNQTDPRPLIDEINSASSNSPIKFDDLRHMAPALAVDILEAVTIANAASVFDQTAASPDYVILYDEAWKHFEAFNANGGSIVVSVSTESGHSYLLLDKRVLPHLDQDEIKSIVSHEISHEIQSITNKEQFLRAHANKSSEAGFAQARNDEYMADMGG